MKKRIAKKKTKVEVVPLGNGWVVRDADTGKFIVISDNKRDAITVSKGIEKSNEMVIALKNKNAKKSSPHSKTSSTLLRKASSPKRATRVTSKKTVVVKS